MTKRLNVTYNEETMLYECDGIALNGSQFSELLHSGRMPEWIEKKFKRSIESTRFLGNPENVLSAIRARGN